MKSYTKIEARILKKIVNNVKNFREVKNGIRREYTDVLKLRGHR